MKIKKAELTRLISEEIEQQLGPKPDIQYIGKDEAVNLILSTKGAMFDVSLRIGRQKYIINPDLDRTQENTDSPTKPSTPPKRKMSPDDLNKKPTSKKDLESFLMMPYNDIMKKKVRR